MGSPDDAQHSPGGKPRPGKKRSAARLASQCVPGKLWRSRVVKCTLGRFVFALHRCRRLRNGIDFLRRVPGGSIAWDRGPPRRRLEAVGTKRGAKDRKQFLLIDVFFSVVRY